MKRFIWTALMISAVLSANAAELVKFNTRDTGTTKAIKNWGIDATWASWENTQESFKNAGAEIDFVRIGFYMHEEYNDDGTLSDDQKAKLDHALKVAEIVDPKIPIMLSPHNEEGIIDWYKESDGKSKFDRWFHVIEITKAYVESKGHKVGCLEVFNEPDYADWNMGDKDDLNDLLRRVAKWKILRVGPSVMNTEWAESWYNEINRNLDAGSTHTLYGTMDQFTDFFDDVTDDRKIAFCPESHSIAEVMVGAEVGVEYAAWWGPIDVARAHFMRACQGKRLAFVAVEKNWSAACVYRAPDGSLNGFIGCAERENGVTTEYKFVCADQDVTYYPDGDMTKGEFRKRGEPFLATAKPPNGPRSQWIKIIPGRPE